jgi:hypothetical protein
MKKLLFDDKKAGFEHIMHVPTAEKAVETEVPHRFQASYNEQHILEELKHYLPAQSALKDFIHHNSLHAYQAPDVL